jgi:hypothetical protein
MTAVDGGAGHEETGVALNSADIIFTTGYFAGTTDFDPGPGTLNLPPGGSLDFFVSKLDTAGNLVWERTLGGSGFDRSNGINIDLDGNAYTTGTFNSTKCIPRIGPDPP